MPRKIPPTKTLDAHQLHSTRSYTFETNAYGSFMETIAYKATTLDT